MQLSLISYIFGFIPGKCVKVKLNMDGGKYYSYVPLLLDVSHLD